MKAMWIAFAAIAAITLAAGFGLDRAGFGTAVRSASADVRLD